MRTEDLFKYGVTPKEGAFAGKKFVVDKITKGAVCCISEEDPAHKEEFTHGSYYLWHEPKTLFEDSTIKPTWGNLKKAVEAAGLGDDTLIAVPRTDWFGFARGCAEPAEFSVEMLREEPYEKPKKFIVVK